MYIDLDIEEEISRAVEDFLAGGSNVATFDEISDVIKRLEALEKEVKELNFWKADRNHSHKEEK
jgi:hypothetical protein